MTRAIVILLAAAGFARADVESGPKAGDKTPAAKVFAVTGAVEGKDVDYVVERKDQPTVFVFANADNFSRPIGRFMKALDGKVSEAGEKAAVVAVWVGGDVEKNKKYMPVLQGAFKFEKTALAVFTGDAAGPDGWALNADAHLTVVVVVGGKVVKSFPFVSVNETDVKGVMEELKQAAKK